jgi:hypothetical protein
LLAAVLLAIAALAGTGAAPAAAATTSSLPSASQTLSSTPPVSLPSSPTRPSTTPSRSGTAPASSLHALPRTGFDVLELVLVGAILLMAGIGLRLRTRDVRSPRS